MPGQLEFSMFHEVLFPPDNSGNDSTIDQLQLRKLIRFNPAETTELRLTDIVVFDFETTGLDHRDDRIIEVGAIRISNMRMMEQFSTLVKTDTPLEDNISRLTGITNEMLVDKPSITAVLPDFIEFFKGAILVAHNAEFDLSFLRAACQRLGYEIEWPCFCTLKLARGLLPELEKKDLDTLANHYQLTFEARHRSIGDAKVTFSVLEQLLANEGAHIQTWREMQPIAMIKE